MALIAGYGGTLTFSGTTSVACRSFTLNWERASLDITQIGDYRERRAAGRIRRFGTVTLYRQDGTIDDVLRTHLQPTTLANAVTATLTLRYVDGAITGGTPAGKQYGDITNAANPINIQITGAVLTDDGTGAAMWELTWEEQ